MLVAQRQAAEVVLGVRRVDRDDVELREFRGDEAAFLAAVALELVGEPEALGESACGKPLMTASGSLSEKMAVPEYPFFTAEFQYS